MRLAGVASVVAIASAHMLGDEVPLEQVEFHGTRRGTARGGDVFRDVGLGLHRDHQP